MPNTQRKRRITGRILAFWSLLQGAALAQQAPMWQLTDLDGLPSLTVYDLHQDREGFIWMATEIGMCRYDGQQFTCFFLPNALSNAFSYIQEDVLGRIWFNNFSGQLFYIQEGKMQLFQWPNTPPAANIKSYAVDKKGQVWVVNGDLYCIDANLKMARPVTRASHFEKALTDVYIDQQDRLYIVLVSGEMYEKKAQGWQLIATDKNQRGIRAFFKEGNFALDHLRNLLYTKEDKKLTPVRYAQIEQFAPIIKATTDREGFHWIITYDGFYGFDPLGSPLHGGLQLLPGKTVSDLILDREGNYWMSTLRSGVFVMPARDILIYNTLNSGLSDDRIFKLAFDKSARLYLGLSNGQVMQLTPNGKIEAAFDTGINHEIEGLDYSPMQDFFWIACSQIFGLKPYPSLKSHRVEMHNPKSIRALGDTALLIASGQSCAILPFTSNAIFEPTKAINLRQRRTRCLWVEPGQRFWAGYEDGLYFYENGNGYPWLDPENNRPVIALSFAQDEQGNLWVGTINQGIYVLRQKKVIQRFTTQNGLSSNYIKALAPDKDVVWIASEKGIQKLNRPTKQLEFIGLQDGLVSKEILDLAVSNQEVWAATHQGLMRIPKTIRTFNQIPPSIRLTGVSVWEEARPLQAAYDLNYGDNNLKIEFLGLAFRSRKDYQYKYRLLGLSDEWVYTQSANNFARFPSLPPGNYIFQVKALNEDGVESLKTAELKIRIRPPFWQKPWFMVLALLALGGLAYGIYQNRIRRLNTKSHYEQNLRASQLTALRAQMNPHFIFNALNSIQDYILQNEKQLANEFLGKFADLMRLTLNLSAQSWVRLSDEIRLLELYLSLEALRFEDTLQYRVEIGPQLQPQHILIPSLLLQPYVENALKHGLLHKKENRQLWVRFLSAPHPNRLICEIEDNGIGREKAAEIRKKRSNLHQSFATSATQNRLDLLNFGKTEKIWLVIEDLKTENNEALGTRVRLDIHYQLS
ncbi:MAG: histidine kinase [Microscillaceae bacterium]|nr:histidine kinase [Microscillaceae bacterium]